MNGAAPISTLVLACGSVLVGLTFGLVYFQALRRTVDLFAAVYSPLRLIGLTLARIAGAFVLLTLMARIGAMPLIAGFLGFLLARSFALRWVQRAS